jgi:hypothetical protein
VHDDPRIRIRLGDAFQVLRQSDAEWDIIISQPSNPWMAGVDQLFSLEYYRLASERLAEGGLFLQWTQRYATNEAIAAISINTLRSVFPHVRVFREGADDLLLASTAPLGDDAFLRAEAYVGANPAIGEALASLGVEGALGLLEREHAEVIRQAESLAHLGLESLDHPRLHYLSGLAFFRGEALDLP